MSPSSVPTKSPKLKAVLDCRHVPIELFGSGQSRFVRKLVYLYIATYADPDGTEAFPGREKIARDCGLTVRGLDNVLRWLAHHRLIRVESKASRLGTNRYTVLFSEEDQATCRASLESDDEQQRLRDKAEQTSLARSCAAKSRWAKRRKCVEGDQERCILAEQSETENTAFSQDAESFASDVEGDPEHAACVPGTECIQPGTQRSSDRPIHRPWFNRPELESKAKPSTTAPPSSRPESDQADIAVADVVVTQQDSVKIAGDPVPVAFDPKRFIAEVSKLLSRYEMSTSTNQAHRDQAFALAQKYNTEVFLAALENWLDAERYNYRSRTWVLEAFINSGVAQIYLDQCKDALDLGVKPSSENIEILHELRESGHTFTPTQAPGLVDLAKEHGSYSVDRAIRRAGDIETLLQSPEIYLRT
jgi:hypothetical protein